MNTSKLVLIIAFLSLSLSAVAQFDHNPRENSQGGRSWIFRGNRDVRDGGVSRRSNGGGGGDADYKKNAIKLNLWAITYKNISLQYERMIGRKTSVALGARVTPGVTGGIVGFSNTDYIRLTQTSLSLSPEFRKYFGRHAGRGFYLGLLGKYDNYNISAPRQYVKNDNSTTDIKFSGNTTFIGGGLSIGTQFVIKNKICFDWWIAGPMYGQRSFELKATSSNFGLSQSDLDDIRAENPLEFFEPIFGKTTSVITNQELSYKVSTSVPAVRVGFCIGYLF